MNVALRKIPSWLEEIVFVAAASKKESTTSGSGQIFFLGRDQEKTYSGLVKKWAPDHLQDKMLKSTKENLQFASAHGPVWIVRTPEIKNESLPHQGLFQDSDYTFARETAGSLATYLRVSGTENATIEMFEVSNEQAIGFLVGLDLAVYNFRAMFDGEEPKLAKGLPQISLKCSHRTQEKEWVETAKAISKSVNLARHLTNLPPNFLHPKSFADVAVQMFAKSSTVKVQVWDHKKLEQEGMGLHLAVGKGAEHQPCLVHLSYRPKGKKSVPIAFVGKGVTFDTGGLDLKPSSAMKLMKKDMGGAAAVLGLCHWVEAIGIDQACDFYLGLAENSVSDRSMRPSDVYKARNGLTVEITNTDAEGRLVLADVLDVAVKNKDKPKYVIDVATLTGAIKVALGSEVVGMFSNNDDLAEMMIDSGHRAGEPLWRMPLVPRYAASMSSQVADLNNSVDGFGGPITAALFLEKFVGSTPWVHLDIYAWVDKATGALPAGGASGQAVQCLASFLESM